MVFGHWACGKQACLVADLGMAFVDDWVMGNEKGRYWLSDDIVGLVGSLAM